MSDHDIHSCEGEPPDFKPEGATHLYRAKPPDHEIEKGVSRGQFLDGFEPFKAAATKLPDPTDIFLASPNYTPGMPSGGWKGITIHFEAGYHDPSVAWLRDRRSQASAHFCVRRDGYIAQLVSESNRAWHAKSAGMTYFGIEHEGGPPAPYFWTTPADATELRADDRMLIESAKLSAYLCAKYGLQPQWDLTMPPRRNTDSVIAGHDQMAGNTHWDPGPTFPRRAYLNRVKQLLASPGSAPTPPKPDPKPGKGPLYVRAKGPLPANKAIAKGATAEEAKKEQERLMRDHGIETTIG